MKTILVLLPLQDTQRETLEAAAPGCRFVYADPAAVTDEQLHAAEIIVGLPATGKLAACERLEFLQLSSSGADLYVKPGVLRPGVVLASATGAYGQSVAEHAFAMTWCLLKKLHLYRDDQFRAVWGDHGTVATLSGATVLVVGLGDIGLYYARLCHAVGAYVVGVKRRPSPCPEGVDELCLTDALDEALPRADVVCSILPGTAGTYHLFDEERFARMKPGAVFLNCGRGTAVDADALCRAAENGPLRAASTDVTEVEPLPADHPLWQQKNVFITPHISGNFHLPGTLDRIVNISAHNLAAFLNGGALTSRIDFQTGYKA